VRFVIVVLLLSTTQSYAQTIYLKYSQWVQMPIWLREVYIAGAFDMLSTVTVPERAATAMFYNECVTKAGLNSSQLTQNVNQYVETQPDLQDKPTPFALMRYLISQCGLPPGQ
jgi:hypothetical protein